MNTPLTAAVVVGNPKRESRTAAVGTAVAEAVLARVGAPDGFAVEVVELADLSGGLFGWGDPAVAQAKELVKAAQLLVVASPVYKASITGLLKAFLDHFGRDELAAVATVPLMVGAAPIHALAVEHQLRPVLIEIGASCPTRGLFVLEKEIDQLDALLEQWLGVWGSALTSVVRTRAEVSGSENAR